MSITVSTHQTTAFAPHDLALTDTDLDAIDAGLSGAAWGAIGGAVLGVAATIATCGFAAPVVAASVAYTSVSVGTAMSGIVSAGALVTAGTTGMGAIVGQAAS